MFDLPNMPPVTLELNEFVPEIHEAPITEPHMHEFGRDEIENQSVNETVNKGKVGRPTVIRSERMTRSRHRATSQKGRNNDIGNREHYNFSKSDDVKWLHDGDEPAFNTSESESLVDEADVEVIIMDDNDGLSDLGEEYSDASTVTDDEGSGRNKRKKIHSQNYSTNHLLTLV